MLFFRISGHLPPSSLTAIKAYRRRSYNDFPKPILSDAWSLLNALSGLVFRVLPRPRPKDNYGGWCAPSGTLIAKKVQGAWRQQFASGEAVYAGFFAERSHSLETDRWWYTHQKLGSARAPIQNALPYLFTFIEMPNVPRTRNHVEGGVNARLKELIRRHRGLSPERKRAVAAFFLTSKMGQNPTQKVT